MRKSSSPPVIPLTSGDAVLETSGGKGTNLARLAQHGFPVPPGFILSTQVYRDFVCENGLDGLIHSTIKDLSPENIETLEKASALIREAFSRGKIDPAVKAGILDAYARLGGGPVSVRSSATTEDLPELSFAGQQDTYLNRVGGEQVLAAVINCWSSLWTARAIGYRLRNQINQLDLALAVIIEEMVQSEASGVLFTANPLTGLLSETVIDATFGLGEALVSGQVEPDHFVVDSLNGQVLSQSLGEKGVSTRSILGGGVETITENSAPRRTLTDGQIKELTAIGQQIQKEYGAPQDIEWALAEGKLYVLQSRAVTSLFPVPKVCFDPLTVWFSFGAVQGMVGPMTPLGQEMIRRISLGGYRIFHAKMEYERLDLFLPAGERIWIRVSDVIRNPLGNRVMFGVLRYVEPSIAQIMEALSADPRLGRGQGKLKFNTLRRLLGFMLPVMFDTVRTFINPVKGRARFDQAIDDYLSGVQILPAPDPYGRLANFTAFVKYRGGVWSALPFLLPRFVPLLVQCLAAINLLNHLGGNQALTMEVTRSLPRNVTTEMDLALWQAAVSIRSDREAAGVFEASKAEDLAARYLEGDLPQAAQQALGDFLEKYGARGIGEIDFGNPRWQDDPTPVVQSLQSYLKIEAVCAPDAQFRKGEETARRAVEELAAIVRRQRGGRFKEKLARSACRRIRLLMGARESPKFFAVRAMGIARSALLEIGKEFAAEGTIERPEDMFFLHIDEMDVLSQHEPRDWKNLIRSRREVYQRELRRRQAPRVLVSDGRAFYEGVGSESDTNVIITGSPVAAGVVEGVVHVVLDPRGTQLEPGEILVCPGTDPAWTPLFMAAGGLITEVGGMMTHGSVVAREYGIPAVVGVHQATLRLKNGQRIRLDGTNGKIMVL